MYGVPGAGLARQGLHALRLALPAPSGAPLAVEAPLPEDLARALDALRGDPLLRTARRDVVSGASDQRNVSARALSASAITAGWRSRRCTEMA